MGAATFFSRTYDEALRLTLEVRAYLSYAEPGERARLAPGRRLVMTRETLRLTTRLTEVMAWLLAQRAVQAGEIPAQEVRDGPLRLSGHAVCLERGPAEDDLPPTLQSLLERSHTLFQRVARLDELARRAVSPAPGE